MRSKVYAGLIGAGAALVLVVVVGALYGAVAGLPPYGEEYGRVKGLDGAFLGMVVFSLYGGIPAIIVGYLVGVFAASRRADGRDNRPGTTAKP